MTPVEIALLAIVIVLAASVTSAAIISYRELKAYYEYMDEVDHNERH